MDGLVGDEEYESESVYTVDTASSLKGLQYVDCENEVKKWLGN